MGDRIDHASAATSRLDASAAIVNAQAMPAHDLARVELAEAQVHATLGLIEQRRIANLIALRAMLYPRYGNHAGGGVVATLIDNPTTPDGSVRVKPDIAAALGIKE